MLLAKIERWYEVHHQNEADFKCRLKELERGLRAVGGSILTVRHSEATSHRTAKVLCEVPIAGSLQRV